MKARRADFVVRVRASCSSDHEHDFREAIERTLRQSSGQSAYEAFSAAC